MLYVVGEKMKKELIVDLIEKLINNEPCDLKLLANASPKTSVEEFLLNTAYRLMNTYIRYNEGMCGRADYLVAIRGFMLTYQVSLRFDNAQSFSNLSDYGIYYDSFERKYYAIFDIPEFIIHKKFVSDSFITASTDISVMHSKYSLKVNSFIEETTGYKSFKSFEQKLCVYGALNTPMGFTSLISMPTGGGKSLVTHVLGYEKNGLSVVIVPTVSLAIDQERAARTNIKCYKEGEIYCYYNGIKNFKEIKTAIEQRIARLLFISPEALIKNEQFSELISKANMDRYLKNIIIDEAHIVVAWGDFFRVDYQCVSPWRNKLLKVNPELRTYLLSATYRDETVLSLKHLFAINNDWIEIRCDSLRKEPRFIYSKAKNYSDKRKKVLDMVNKLPHPMILYVNAPYEADQWKDYLENKGFSNINTFTGDTKANERRDLIDNWVNNKFDLMIATSAFGVGVDKPDVRSVVHLYMPESPDTYYQELGRGGRDGLPCISVMCIAEDDVSRAFNHVSKVLTTDKFWGRWWSMYCNPNNQWQGGNIAIMTSTKPNYNKINYFEEGNDTDEKWNINVLLLLNRKKQIKITGLDLDAENRYIFTVKILNDVITQETSEAKAIFRKIRDEESKKSQKAFFTIKDAIDKSDRLCWSEMFFETYPLVSECCPGCNCHENMIITESNRFPLVVDVKGPEKKLTDEMVNFFANTNEALIITEENPSELIQKYKPNVVVSNSLENINESNIVGINYMNFQEFRALQVHDNGFYTSGLVMAIYDDDKDQAKTEYQTIYKYLNKKRYVIHVSKHDFCVSSDTEKMIADQIDGTVIR